MLFKRLGDFGWSLLTAGAGATVEGYFFEFGSYLLPLGVLELYLRARAGRSRKLQLAAALVLLVITAYACVGTVAYGRWVLRRHGWW